MLSLILAVASAQVTSDFSPPPPPPAVQIESPSAQLQELRQLRQLTRSLQTQLDLSRQLADLSVEIATFDTSGPGWAKSLRVISYLLAVPAFAFAAPVFSGKSPAVGATTLFAGRQTMMTVTPTLNLVGVVLAIVVSAAFVVGVAGGIIGWASRHFELKAMVQTRVDLTAQSDALR